MTFDPGFLSRIGVRAAPGDAIQASSWYSRALELGNPTAQELVKNLKQQRVSQSGSPPH